MVKSIVKNTKGTMLFSQQRVRLKITQSKIGLTVQGYNAFFSQKSKTKDQPVKISVNGTEKSQCYYPEEE